MEHDEKEESLKDSLCRQTISSKVLTDMDRKILLSEGFSVNPIAPLTKAQELAIKKVRRKLKNKISAQESRRKKKEYIENLEKRVRSLRVENDLLRRKMETQDQTLRSLTFQIRKMKRPEDHDQKMNCQSKGTQTGICLKCYLQKQAAYNGTRDDFKVQTGKNGRIVVRSESLEGQNRAINESGEYSELRNMLLPQQTYGAKKPNQ